MRWVAGGLKVWAIGAAESNAGTGWETPRSTGLPLTAGGEGNRDASFSSRKVRRRHASGGFTHAPPSGGDTPSIATCLPRSDSRPDANQPIAAG